MKWFSQLNIDRKYTIMVVASLLLSLIVVSIVILSSMYQTFNTMVINNSKEINKQVILNYENYFDNVRDLGYYIESNSRDIQRDDLSSFFENVASADLDIITISLLDLEGLVIATNRRGATVNGALTTRIWYQRAVGTPEVFYFSIPHQQDVFLGESQEVISVSKMIDYITNDGLQQGVLVIELSTEQIDVLARQTNLGENGHLNITSDSGKLIYSSNDTCTTVDCPSNQLVNDIIIGGAFVTVDDTDMYVNINTIAGTRWRIATFVNVEIIAQSRRNIIWTLAVIFLVTLLIVAGLVALVTRQITKPLNALKEHMSNIQHSDHLYQEISVRGQKEVVILADAYNDMIHEIRRLLDRLVTEQTEMRKTELKALQTQINPHFLYNTLDSIVWLSEQKRNDSVIQMVVALSRFFRISISRGRDIISIEEEVQHAKYYLQIQQIRYGNRFSYEFDINKDLLSYRTVKLILQPLIENAIQHGIVDDVKGRIQVAGYEAGGLLYFSVTNNGYGLTDDQIQEIYHKIDDDQYNSVGLKNVAQRLQLYYGKYAGIRIQSVLDQSTTITIYFPREMSE